MRATCRPPCIRAPCPSRGLGLPADGAGRPPVNRRNRSRHDPKRPCPGTTLIPRPEGRQPHAPAADCDAPPLWRGQDSQATQPTVTRPMGPPANRPTRRSRRTASPSRHPGVCLPGPPQPALNAEGRTARPPRQRPPPRRHPARGPSASLLVRHGHANAWPGGTSKRAVDRSRPSTNQASVPPYATVSTQDATPTRPPTRCPSSPRRPRRRHRLKRS